jgi:hypothetical protein
MSDRAPTAEIVEVRHAFEKKTRVHVHACCIRDAASVTSYDSYDASEREAAFHAVADVSNIKIGNFGQVNANYSRPSSAASPQSHASLLLSEA